MVTLIIRRTVDQQRTFRGANGASLMTINFYLYFQATYQRFNPSEEIWSYTCTSKRYLQGHRFVGEADESLWLQHAWLRHVYSKSNFPMFCLHYSPSTQWEDHNCWVDFAIGPSPLTNCFVMIGHVRTKGSMSGHVASTPPLLSSREVREIEAFSLEDQFNTKLRG